PGNVVLPIIGREKGSVLENVIKETKPDAVLEIGALVGYSSILMAKNMKKGRIISIEVNKKNTEAAKMNIERAGFKDRIEVINGDALEIIPELGETFDVIFIDAQKESYFRYLKAAEPLMADNATIVADNAKRFAAEMKDYLDYVRANYSSKLHDFGADGVEVSRRI
ncbi:tRNA (adenine(22)-N(1))-methyltransferase TrmK, partial [Candidatus Woesearchaeota archaeon]|nr:tRNA (adenine(22)-N(1))-methyltransferase TrmK [Candidatus Woesearchaeota archaeon]